MKYEYKSEYKDNCFEDSVTETSWLNEMGNEGWELVRASQRTSSSRIYYFKRAVPSPDDKDKEISRLKELLNQLLMRTQRGMPTTEEEYRWWHEETNSNIPECARFMVEVFEVLGHGKDPFADNSQTPNKND